MRVQTQGVVIAAMLLVNGCAHGPLSRDRIRAHMLHPDSLMCSDGRPVKLLISFDCERGLCGWSCLRDRWDRPE